jgi:haloacetate dehalogenase
LPTADAFASIDASTAIKLWHWFLQSQEGGLPERMIAAVVDEYVHALLQEPAGAGFIFDPVSVDDYLASFRDASCIHAACEDYRAAWYVDRILDERQEGKICLEAPLLLLWGREGALAERDPIKVWRKWASNIQGHVVPGGHFVPEEACRAVVEAFNTFFIEDNLNKASFI